MPNKPHIHTAKFRRCIKEVSKKGKGKYNPFAVCKASIGYEKSILPSHRRMAWKLKKMGI